MHQWSKKRKKEFKQTIYYYYLFTNTLLILFSPLISNYLFDKLFTIINFHSKKKKRKIIYFISSRVNTVTFIRGKRKSAKPKFLTTCSIKPNGEIHSSHFSPFSFSSPPLSFHVSRETPSKTTREGWRGEINNEKFHPTASREERSSFSSSSSIPSSPWKFILITSRLASFVVRCMRRGEEVGAKKECPIRLEVCRR